MVIGQSATGAPLMMNRREPHDRGRADRVSSIPIVQTSRARLNRPPPPLGLRTWLCQIGTRKGLYGGRLPSWQIGYEEDIRQGSA